MKSTLLLILGCCCRLIVFAQAGNGKIAGSVQDNGEKAIEAATIRLLQAKDQKWVKSAITDRAGKFVLEGIVAGKYVVSITAVGFTDQKSGEFEITPADSVKQLPQIVLEKSGKVLQEVTVTGKKPMVE